MSMILDNDLRQARIAMLAKEIRRNEKEVYLDFNNALHSEFFCLQLGGEEYFQKEFPDLYACYLNTKEMQKKNRDMLKVGEQDAFRDAAQILYAFQDENHVMNIKAITALRRSVNFIGEKIYIYYGNDLIGFSGRVTSNTHFTKYEVTWKNSEEKYQTGEITYDYFSMWYNEEENFLRAVVHSSSNEVISEEANSCVKSISVQNPVHKHTPENEEITVCYNRIPTSGEYVDYNYAEAYDPETGKQQLFLEVDGEVTLNEAFREFLSIDVTKFVLKLYCDSGVANYNTDGRVQEIKNSFQKSDNGFTFHLDKDWKGVVPAARLPIVDDVEFLMRVPFVTTQSTGSILIDSTLSPEKISENRISISKFHLLWGCVAGETKVRMDDGSQQQICNIKIGDRVLLKDGKVAVVRDVMVGEEKLLWHIETKQGHSINCTKDHPIYTDSGVKSADALNGADKLLNEQNNFEEITAIYLIPGGKVYSLVLGENEGSWLVTNGLYSGDSAIQNQMLRMSKEDTKQYSITSEVEKLMKLFEYSYGR